MIAKFFSLYWKQILDAVVFCFIAMVTLPLSAFIAVKTILRVRTKWFWTPKVGDRVLTHGMKNAQQIITRVMNKDNFTCTTAPFKNYTGTHSSGPWNRKYVTFIERGEWE